jgi:hypothetical protein
VCWCARFARSSFVSYSLGMRHFGLVISLKFRDKCAGDLALTWKVQQFTMMRTATVKPARATKL